LRHLLALIMFCAQLSAESFAGAVAGLATLSADAAKIGSPATAFSMYKPENGAAAMLFAGYHLSDWWSVQASYGWNRNSVLLSAGIVGSPSSAYDLAIRAAMHTVVVEALIYFRRTGDRLRPYLSAGPGVAVLRGEPRGATVSGAIAPPSPEFDFTGACFRVAVGVDVRISRRLAIRYSFAETIQANTISRELQPEGRRNLANFQNLWGLAWRF
jgi:hypothetical protein